MPTTQPFRLLRLLCVLWWSLSPAAARAQENQRNVLEPLAVWNAVGRVNVPTGFCTGTLIAPDQVLTAAHCVADARGGRLFPADQIHFLAGFRRGGFAAHARGLTIRTAPDLVLDAQGHPRELDRDWAVVTLDRAIADGDLLQPLPLGNAAQAPGMLVGYGRDRPFLPSRQQPCPILGRQQGSALLLHGCVAPNGMSGAPLLQQVNGTWEVVGVHIASVETTTGRTGAAVAIRRSVPVGALR